MADVDQSLDLDAWLAHLGRLAERARGLGGTASDEKLKSFRWDLMDALHRVTGREHWLPRFQRLHEAPQRYTWDARYSDEHDGEVPRLAGYGSPDIQVIEETYFPWVTSRWLRDHADLLDELIASERMAAEWVLPRWRRVWNATSDRLIGTAFVAIGTIVATLVVAYLLSELGIPR